jgi:glycosyltransferase involved in cell wall biosynthesis
MNVPEPSAESRVKSPLRVALCITELDPGGAEKALFEIVTRLDRGQWIPKVFCLGPETELSRRLITAGIETVCFGVTRVTQVGVLFRLVRELRTFRPAVLQTFLFHANILGRIAGTLAGVPRIFSGLRVAEKQKRWHMWFDRWTQWFVQMNVCVSEGVRQHAIEAGLSPQKLCVIPNGIDAALYASAIPADLTEFGIPREAWTMVTVGRLTHQKGHDLLLQAVAALLFDDSQLHLLIVGEGEDRAALSQLAKDLGIAPQVHLPGWRAEIPEILAACQLFVFPSRWEGMPNALLEAMASGLPCIATDVEGVRELLGPGNSGTIVTSGDVNVLRMAVKSACDRGSRDISDRSQNISVKEHTWELVARSYSSTWLFSEFLPPPHDV